MRTLFLDIDGVLNRSETRERSFDQRQFDPGPVEQLARILHETDAYIVITSGWRFMLKLQEFRTIFDQHGLPSRKILGCSPILGRPEEIERGQEIEAWLAKHTLPGVWTCYAILDDFRDMGQHIARLVQTKTDQGLTREEADRVIALLSEKEQRHLGA